MLPELAANGIERRKLVPASASLVVKPRRRERLGDRRVG
jgi:hypothetical protein